MRIVLKKMLLLLLCAALAVTGFGCNRPLSPFSEPSAKPLATAIPAASPVPVVSDEHAAVPFSDMVYTRPDTEAIRADMEALFALVEAGAPATELLSSYYAIYDRFGEAESAMSLAYLYYAFDVTDTYYEQEYAYLQSELNAIDLLMTEVSIRVIESSGEAKRAMEAAYGADFLGAVYEQQSLNSEAIQSLQEQEVSLVNTYNRAANDFRFSYEGKEYSYDDVMGATDIADFNRLYEAYVSALNETVGGIFLELVQVRAAISEKLGYGSYAAYMYDCYGRDYTLDDAKRLQRAVKAYIVPVYLSAFGLSAAETFAGGEAAADTGSGLWEKLKDISDAFSYYIGGEESTEYGGLDLSETAYPLEAFLTQLQDVTADFSPELYVALRHMLRNGLYDFSVNPNKMSGSFTTYMSAYDEPFIFSQWENTSTDIDSVIHELGHFLNYYRNPSVGWSAGDSLDLAEVDSQGLELLMMRYYDRFYGALAPYAEQEMLINAMYALIAGCMEDEFQQAVYADPDMTLSEMNDAYRKLASEYGFDALYGYTGKEWAEIPHTFQSPMYYVSYAASMVPALALWRLSDTDTDAARNAYFAIVDRPPYAAFLDTVSENGLPDPFADATIRDIADVIAGRLL